MKLNKIILILLLISNLVYGQTFQEFKNEVILKKQEFIKQGKKLEDFEYFKLDDNIIYVRFNGITSIRNGYLEYKKMCEEFWKDEISFEKFYAIKFTAELFNNFFISNASPIVAHENLFLNYPNILMNMLKGELPKDPYLMEKNSLYYLSNAIIIQRINKDSILVKDQNSLIRITNIPKGKSFLEGDAIRGVIVGGGEVIETTSGYIIADVVWFTSE